MNSLSLRFEPEPHDTVGRLFIHVGAASFKGDGFFWAEPHGLEEFAQALAAYPIPADQPAEVRFGYNDCEGDDLIIGIAIAPVDAIGHLRVSVEVADLYQPDNRLSVAFQSTYSEVDTFRNALGPLLDGQEAKATLLAR
jgi:hypothetical protein